MKLLEVISKIRNEISNYHKFQEKTSNNRVKFYLIKYYNNYIYNFGTLLIYDMNETIKLYKSFKKKLSY